MEETVLRLIEFPKYGTVAFDEIAEPTRRQKYCDLHWKHVVDLTEEIFSFRSKKVTEFGEDFKQIYPPSTPHISSQFPFFSIIYLQELHCLLHLGIKPCRINAESPIILLRQEHHLIPWVAGQYR